MKLAFECSVTPDGIDWIATVKVEKHEYRIAIPGPATEDEALDRAERHLREVIEKTFGSNVKSITTENRP